MASPFHGVGDFEHHHFAMTTNPAKFLQNLTHTIARDGEATDMSARLDPPG